MTVDAALRVAAVAAAVALVVAPKWGAIATAAVRVAQAAYDAAKRHGKSAGRVAAAGLLVAAAWGKVPLPQFGGGAVERIEVEAPDAEMRKLVEPIAEAMRSLPASDRMIWASTWSKASLVVSAPDGPEALFSDTKSLRLFTTLAIDIAWRRIGGNEPGSNEALRKAVEAAYAAGIGPDGVAVSRAVRERYAAFARAVAWAGIGEG